MGRRVHSAAGVVTFRSDVLALGVCDVRRPRRHLGVLLSTSGTATIRAITRAVNAAELALLAGNENLASGHGDVPWGKLLRLATVWLLWAQYFCLSYPWYFYITWLPTFLQGTAIRTAAGNRAKLAILPLFFGGFGSLFCGFVSGQRRAMDR